jgi:hypothetical protein
MSTNGDLQKRLPIFRKGLHPAGNNTPYPFRGIFYLPHMEYEGSIGVDSSVEKNENFSLLIFTFWDFLWLKNMI